MALKWIEGFDFWAEADVASLYEEQSGLTTGHFTIPSGARNGAGGMRINPTSGGNTGNDWLRKTIGGTEDTVIVGFACAPFQNDTATIQLMGLYEGTTLHTDIRMATGSGQYTLTVTRNGTVLGTATNALIDGVYHYIELKCTIHDTTGSFELRVNGVNVASGTNQDTQNGGTGYVDRVLLGNGVGQNSSHDIRFDDWYICDDTGSVNNNFLGDVRVAALAPSGAGTTTQWTPSTGSNFQNVDDTTANGDTDYNSESTAGDIDLFAMGNLPTNATSVAGIKEIVYHRKDDAGSRTLRHVLRTASTNYESADIAVADTYAYHVNLRETNPNTSAAWTQSDVDGLEAGYKLQA